MGLGERREILSSVYTYLPIFGFYFGFFLFPSLVLWDFLFVFLFSFFYLFFVVVMFLDFKNNFSPLMPPADQRTGTETGVRGRESADTQAR